jgi:hypothetical protein
MTAWCACAWPTCSRRSGLGQDDDRSGRPTARYRYVGPSEIRSAALAAPARTLITSAGDFERWTASMDTADFTEPFTYVVDVDGVLRLHPRSQ